MIKIGQSFINYETLRNQLRLNQTQQEIVERMSASPVVFGYDSLDQLRFELKLRNDIVKSAKALNDSGASFGSFSRSRSNPDYWNTTDFGGFQLRYGVRPSDAIRDIFTNGSEYAFECSTAIIILYYRAVLQSIGAQTFDRLFPTILLFDGQYDEGLGLTTQDLTNTVVLPGDVLYFDNPDYNPETPEWMGENVVYLGNGLFYGHGIGIMGASEMIYNLNTLRMPGARRSAYLMNRVARPDFASLARYSTDSMP
ncbi:protein-glutamine gamma-glutamyltransferase [Brevibacillus fluminis]|uniref:Protein-glutamine gamma-glutamyltransferase n=1 Tax=Brevibacillus fluminis TaxID=511487 RepID=A0A3M8DKU9_9BACL|nr:protein-glutamine gamma-glutamyltransferase [Brevibacillus fluminis]RNB87727.1 protein-glutamine gamma-glutamyltransferase [Brevibacillus fluminis]